MSTAELLEVVPTLRFGRKQTTHGYRLDIQGKDVVILTRCGMPTTGEEYTITHGVVTCSACSTGGDA